MTISWDAAAATHVGRVREANEDAYHADPSRGVFLVADGMGGHAAGEIASGLVAEVTSRALARAVDEEQRGTALADALRAAVTGAHRAILECCRGAPATRGMGTTITAVVIDPEGVAHAVHVGDSRLYLFGRRGAAQLTRDHTWVQQEVDAGKLSAADARHHPLSHVLVNVLTDDAEAVMDLLAEPLEPGDLLLLATDGLYNMLDDGRIAELATSDRPLSERAARLVEEANRAGGTDNVTVVLVGIAA